LSTEKCGLEDKHLGMDGSISRTPQVNQDYTVVSIHKQEKSANEFKVIDALIERTKLERAKR